MYPVFIIMARWLSLAWQDVQTNVSQQLSKKKHCLNWEGFLAVTTPSALQPASSSCEEAPGLRICFVLVDFSLSPPAGEYLEVGKCYSLLLNTNPRGATTDPLLESRVCPSVWMESHKHRHECCYDTNSKMFCLQLQTLALARSSRPSCRTWWLRGACSPSERSSERVGASHLQLLSWNNFNTNICCTEKHQLTVVFILKGEFGSVVEGHLRQTDGTSEKVAVKTMKCEIF